MIEAASVHFSTWCEVTLGRYKSGEEYLKSLQGKFRFSPYLVDVIRRIECSQTLRTLELVIGTGQELGCTRQASRDEITVYAHESGLVTCPAETALAMLDQHPNLLPLQKSVLAMDTLWNPSMGVVVLAVVAANKSHSALLIYGGNNESPHWDPTTQWIFSRLKA